MPHRTASMGVSKWRSVLNERDRSGAGLSQHRRPGHANFGPEKPGLQAIHANHDPHRSYAHQPAPNTLDQDFTADAPNRKWVTDITYLATATGWVYLAVVLDLFSRKVVGWALGPTLETELVSTALRRAIETRRPDGQRLLHHSDRGCQYTSTAYRQTLKTLGIACSMSRTGCCYDNAVMERFFWSLKHEWTNHEQFATLKDARLSVFRYIETFYNSERLHQTLGYQSPTSSKPPVPADHAPASAA
jgi:transposase InsO family protein